MIDKYNLRQNEMRLDDFRSTIAEIVDAEHHGIVPRDAKELDPETYGRRIDLTL